MSDERSRPEPMYGTGRLAQYYTLPGWDPHEDFVGPLYERQTEGVTTCAVELDARHCNTSGVAHGGLLVTFADYASFAIARASIGGAGGATVSLNSDFCAAAREGELLEADGEVVRETGSLVFVRGRLYVGDATVMVYSSVVKKPRRGG